MSKIVKPTGYRALSHVVQTDNGEYFMVDSNYTLDYGYETMAFEWDERKDEVSNWCESYVERYRDKDTMAHRHEQICNNLEQYLHEREEQEDEQGN